MENFCLRVVAYDLSALFCDGYGHVDNSSPRGENIRLVEVASRWADDQIEQAFEVVRAVEVDAHNATLAAEHLNMHVGLKVLSELLLDSLGCRVGR